MSAQLDQLLAQALQLTPKERLALSEALAASVQKSQPADEPRFTDEEIE